MKDFSFDTVPDFDDHIRRSIPGYEGLLQQIALMAPQFIQPRSYVLDLGCSTGSFLNNLFLQTPPEFRTRFIGYDKSTHLLPPLPETDYQTNGSIRQSEIGFRNEDIHNLTFGADQASLILALFTLSFARIAPGKPTMKSLLKAIYRGLKPGGAFIVADKNYMAEGQVQELFATTLDEFKLHNGFTPEDIYEKRKALRTIMKPVREQDMLDQLREAGFTIIESFYQMLAFKAWVCIKL